MAGFDGGLDPVAKMWPLIPIVSILALVGVACGGGNTRNAVPMTESTPSEALAAGRYEERSVAGILSRDDRFQTLVRILEEAEVRVGPPPGTLMGTAAEVMSQPGWDHTIFAPIDAAFDSLDEGTFESLFETENATQLIGYHIVPRIISSTDIDTGELLTVGGPIRVTVEDSDIRYGAGRVIETDIEASNGIIHVIDALVVQ